MARFMCKKTLQCPTPGISNGKPTCLYGPAIGTRNPHQSIFYDSCLEADCCSPKPVCLRKESCYKKIPTAIILQSPDPCSSSVCLPSASKCMPSYSECQVSKISKGSCNKTYVGVSCANGEASEQPNYTLSEVVSMFLVFILLALLCCYLILLIIDLILKQGTNTGVETFFDAFLIMLLTLFLGLCFKILLNPCICFKSVLILLVVWTLWSLCYHYRAFINVDNKISIPFGKKDKTTPAGGAEPTPAPAARALRYIFDEKSKKTWDFIQKKYSCCGIDGPNTWIEYNIPIPLSCCHNDSSKNKIESWYCKSKNMGNYVYKKGCVDTSFVKLHDSEDELEDIGKPFNTLNNREYEKELSNNQDVDVSNERTYNKQKKDTGHQVYEPLPTHVPKQKNDIDKPHFHKHQNKNHQHHKRMLPHKKHNEEYDEELDYDDDIKRLKNRKRRQDPPPDAAGESKPEAGDGDDDKNKVHIVSIMLVVLWFIIFAIFLLVAAITVM